MPRFSIITVAYNAADTIGLCLESVAAQKVDMEHIVVDGASTDGTLEWVSSRQRANPFLRIISEPDDGVYDAMNKGIAAARGDIIGFLNADDTYDSSKTLERIALAFDDPATNACYGDLVYVDKINPEKVVRYWRAGHFSKGAFHMGWMPPHPTFYAKRSVYETFGAFNTKLGSAADYEIMLRFLLKHGISTKYIPEILVAMKTGGISNRSLKNRLRANQMDRLAWQVNGLKPLPFTFAAKPIRKIGQFFATRPRWADAS